MDAVFSRDKFFISQNRVFAPRRKYLVVDEAKNKLLYIEATALIQLKPAFVAYRDESKQHKFFSFRQEKVFGGNHAIADEDDRPIGEIKRNLGWLMDLKGWQLYDPSGRELARIRLSIPFTRSVTKVNNWKERLIFEFFTPSGQLIGDLTSGFFFRRATLNLSGDPNGSLDRRLAISACIVSFIAATEGAAAS